MLPQRPEPDRHRKVVRAAVSPSAGIVTAAGVIIGLALHSVVLAVVLGAGAWLARLLVAAAVNYFRRLPLVDIDPWAVPDPWRQFVRQSLDARNRFDQALASCPPGPLRDRLTMLRPRLEAGVQEVWTMAHQGAALTAATMTNRPGDSPPLEELSRQLRQTQAERAALGDAAPERRAILDRREEALAAQVQARRKAEEAAAVAQDRLQLLTARLDQAVTSVLELTAGHTAGADGDLGLDTEEAFGSIDSLTDEIASLRAGFREATASLPPAAPGQPPPVPPES